jgi:hypothetical protein
MEGFFVFDLKRAVRQLAERASLKIYLNKF